jgi:hypothetical protein
MNKQDKEYFDYAGKELLGQHVGEDNALEFFALRSGKWDDLRGEPEYEDGTTWLLKFWASVKQDPDQPVEFDQEYFAEQVVKRYSGMYVDRCGCAYDCCGHAFTANMDIHHKSSGPIYDHQERMHYTPHTWTAIISNGVNL